MKRDWKIALLLCTVLFAAGCQPKPQTEALPNEPAPGLVAQEVEIKRLQDCIGYNSEEVVAVRINEFYFGPTVAEKEIIIPDYDAAAFADKLGYFTTVVDFDETKVGQGMGYTRYTMTMSDGSTVSFCKNGESFFLSDSADPIQMGKSDSVEYLCSSYKPYEPQLPPNCSIILYDYPDDTRTARTLDSYLNLRSDEVIKFEREEYFASGDGSSYNCQLLILENESAKAAAQAMADTVMLTAECQYEQMGLAQSCRYTFTYEDGSELSFCEDGIIFLSDSEFPSCNEEAVEALCVLERGTDFEIPIPEDAVIVCGIKTKE